MMVIPRAKEPAKKIPMTESSLSFWFWLKIATKIAVMTPATRPPTTSDPPTTKATARPGKTEWATASPMKTMPRMTTWQPTNPVIREARTTAASARARKARLGLKRSWINS